LPVDAFGFRGKKYLKQKEERWKTVLIPGHSKIRELLSITKEAFVTVLDLAWMAHPFLLCTSCMDYCHTPELRHTWWEAFLMMITI